jgi:outer membrane protein assembly factor BamB
VLHDRAADVYLVSNINGSPADKDNNGFISRVSPDGAATVGKWIESGVNGVTLDAPKGMTIKGDTLYVADIDNVRVFDRNTGAPLASWAIEGASFLNDMATGPDGTLYVSDSGLKGTPEGLAESGSDAVYRLGANGAATAVAKDPSLGRPNGLFVDSSGIIVVTFGSGQVYRLDPATGAKTDMPPPPAGQLDGVVRLADGSLLVSSWGGSAVYRLIGEDAYGTAVDSVTSPADIGYDMQRGRVLIPSFMDNKVVVQEVR